MKLTKIKPNPKNPRVIRDWKFEKLKKSIQDFPKMLAIRPIVVDKDNIILGGNMRYRALQDLGYKDIPDEWVRKEDELSEQERKQFILADNGDFGDWDMDALANEWEIEEVEAWAGIELDLPDFEPVGIEEQGKLDEVEPQIISCPYCGKEFDAKKQK